MKRARILLAGGVIVLAAGVIAVTALSSMPPSSSAAPTAALPAATAEVTRGPLRDTKTVTGTLSYGELSTLRANLEASAMVTWLAPEGSLVKRGQALYALDGTPTLLFYGSVPMHRTLRFDLDAASPVWVEEEQAATAADVATLALDLAQERLADARARTADGEARLADALSAAPATAEFSQLVGAVRAAEAKVGRVKELTAAELAPAIDIAVAEAGLDSARAAFDAAVRELRKGLAAARLDAATGRAAVAEAQAEFDDARTALEALAARDSAETDVAQIAENLAALGYDGPLANQVRAWQRDAGLPATGIVGPQQLVVTSGPVHIAAHDIGVGETVAASSPEGGSILDYSGTDKIVTAALAVGDQGLAAIGRAVTVTLPDDADVQGTISAIGSVVVDGAIEVTVTVADQAALADLEVAAVDVEFVSDSRDDVLSVPIAALLALPEGGFAVEAVRDGRSSLVPVKAGLFAAGRVEVAGDGVAEGLRVGVPR